MLSVVLLSVLAPNINEPSYKAMHLVTHLKLLIALAPDVFKTNWHKVHKSF
jgi:hypothetical protein